MSPQKSERGRAGWAPRQRREEGLRTDVVDVVADRREAQRELLDSGEELPALSDLDEMVHHLEDVDGVPGIGQLHARHLSSDAAGTSAGGDDDSVERKRLRGRGQKELCSLIPHRQE